MTTKPIPVCGTHHVKKEWRQTTFEYSDEGITVRVPNIYAWVCPESGEASFTPDTVDELVTTVRELSREPGGDGDRPAPGAGGAPASLHRARRRRPSGPGGTPSSWE
ncbi:MAG: YgiT-type zinc finger protein [Anaerolineae bacterium]|nr:YgiT-type zinc finger protein [Anaerolineae bacterium]